MMPSTLNTRRDVARGRAPGLHVAIIMDGNGRWATARGMPRLAGHKAGAEAVRRTVEAAPSLGIATLTLYAFSSDNWRRPPSEVASLMSLFRRYLASESERLAENGVHLTIIGRRDRLSPSLLLRIELAERLTEDGRNLRLRLAIDYSARDAILRAASELARESSPADASRHARQGESADAIAAASRESFASYLGRATGSVQPSPDVDLLIRTGGEQRLSDFLLWECAYAELLFSPLMWPEFDADALEQAVGSFHSRQRRFGMVPIAV